MTRKPHRPSGRAAASPASPATTPPASPAQPPGALPAGPAALTPRQILINNEQVKLTANIFNVIAGAFIIAGGAGVYAAFSGSSDAATIVRTALWIGVGVIVHWYARRLLRNLL